MHPALSHPGRPVRPLWARLAARVAVVAAVLLAVGLALYGAAAGAQVAPDGNASPDAPVSAVFTVNNTLVTLLTGLVVPLVVGLVTREDNPAWVKLGLAVAVTGVANLFVQAVQDDGTAVLSQEWLVQAAIIFATAIGTYARVWRPLARDAGATVSSIGSPSFGIVPVTRTSTQRVA